MYDTRYWLLLVLYLVDISFASLKKGTSNDTSLQLVHVLFRHGDRTPSKIGLAKNNPYYNESFYLPYGYGQLTNNGKRTSYNVGVALRKRYDNFLGDTWNINHVEARSTDYDRTKMSIMLVLAGLYEPKGCQIWKRDLRWQPIPYSYREFSRDMELSSWACPTVVPLLYNNLNIAERLKKYDGLIKVLSDNMGEDVDYIHALDLYFGLLIQTELGFPLENWTQLIYPEPFRSYIVDFYHIETSTAELKTVIAGYFIKKVLSDTLNKINGTLDPKDRKMFLYSAHETNIATLLTSLESYNLVEVPSYGSYVIFEVHRIDGIYGIKMFYQDQKGDEPRSLTLPGCEVFCPLGNFTKLTEGIIPKSKGECFGER